MSCISLSRTTLNYAAGARGRLSGLTVAAISAVVLFVNPGFVGYVPKFVLGGLLFYLGLDLMFRWLIESARKNGVPEVEVTIDEATVRIPLAPDKPIAEPKEIVL